MANSERPLHEVPIIRALTANAKALREVAERRTFAATRTPRDYDEINRTLDDTKSLEKAAIAASEAYAKNWNSKVAALILAELPRELRNIIYKALIELDVDIYGLNQRTRREVDQKNNGITFKPGNEEGFPHYFQQNYMGMEFAAEISEVYQESRMYALKHQADNNRFHTTEIIETQGRRWFKPRRM